MSAEGDRIRRVLGIDLVNAQREESARHPVKAIPKVEKPADRRKQADETCDVNGELLKGIVLG